MRLKAMIAVRAQVRAHLDRSAEASTLLKRELQLQLDEEEELERQVRMAGSLPHIRLQPPHTYGCSLPAPQRVRQVAICAARSSML